jgi:hypothetical protein
LPDNSQLHPGCALPVLFALPISWVEYYHSIWLFSTMSTNF